MQRRHLFSSVVALVIAIVTPWAHSVGVAPEVFVQRIAEDVIGAVKSDRSIQAGDTTRIRALVDAKVVPHVDFERMTSTAVGPQWRGATTAQRQRLLAEFKTLLITTYAGALTQVRDQTVTVKPPRSNAGDDLVVRSEVRGRGEPIALDYRLERSGEGWKIYDLNVGGFWIVQTYRSQFQQDLSTGGIDALIAKLAEKNGKLAAPASKS